jgi:hypothetical protein
MLLLKEFLYLRLLFGILGECYPVKPFSYLNAYSTNFSQAMIYLKGRLQI